MAEVEATIPENSETIEAPAIEEPPAAQESSPEPKRGRGRPAGSKDKTPRTAKPKVRVEPIPHATPQPKAKPAPAAKPPVDEEVAESRSSSSQLAPPVERPPSPEPPSPRTLFRQTSAHLLNLRDVMNSHKRADAAQRYTNRLHAWPVV